MSNDLSAPRALPPAVLQRRAVVYVRQSTPSRVMTNLESQRQQYDLLETARLPASRTRRRASVRRVNGPPDRFLTLLPPTGQQTLRAWRNAGHVKPRRRRTGQRLRRRGRRGRNPRSPAPPQPRRHHPGRQLPPPRKAVQRAFAKARYAPRNRNRIELKRPVLRVAPGPDPNVAGHHTTARPWRPTHSRSIPRRCPAY